MHTAVQHVETLSGHMVNYFKDLVRIPTVNPLGDHYPIDDLAKTTQVSVQVALTLLS
jgi:hypothetical protein